VFQQKERHTQERSRERVYREYLKKKETQLAPKHKNYPNFTYVKINAK
jgi:hypothetical protein